jgi:hypothetical protein
LCRTSTSRPVPFFISGNGKMTVVGVKSTDPKNPQFEAGL